MAPPTQPNATGAQNAKTGILSLPRQEIVNELNLIYADAWNSHSVDAHRLQDVMDAASSSDSQIVIAALNIIYQCNGRYKTAFEAILNKLAADHHRPNVAMAAYRAMTAATSLDPYASTLEQGCQSISKEIATAALIPISEYAATMLPPSLPAALHSSVIAATQHANSGVVIAALDVISDCDDKTPFETVINQHAQDHTLPNIAKAAYNATWGATDLSPFASVLEKGCQSASQEIAAAALIPIFRCASKTASLPAVLHPAVIAATQHPSPTIIAEALPVIYHCNDKTPFIASLNSLLTHPHRGIVAMTKAILQEIGNALPPPLPSLHGIRLNFNTEANGGGVDKHQSDVVKSMQVIFAQAVNNHQPVNALVFYDEHKRLPEGKSIPVRISGDEVEQLLTYVLQGIAPSCNLAPQQDGTYQATLTHQPTI
ncbi:MAG TPA: hypothetical protein DCM27_01335 [Rhodospirillaceae bacterium]|nr:hypothetical protein [Rhodospirillaceae bacterium]